MKLMLAQQGIYDAKSLRKIGSEVLSRWMTSTNRILRPCDICPDWAAVDLDVIKTLCSDAYRARACEETLFLNVSKELLKDNTSFQCWLEYVRTLQATNSIDLVIEITEAIPDYLLSIRCGQIRETGVRMALDDFNEGHSDTARLKGFEWDFCKINVGLLEDQTSKDALNYCRRKGIAVIAECIEDTEHFVAAHEAQIKLHQGFYWQRPVFVVNAFKVAAPC